MSELICWEYRIENPEGLSITELRVWLNEYGDHGWELIAILPTGQYFFKRPL